MNFKPLSKKNCYSFYKGNKTFNIIHYKNHIKYKFQRIANPLEFIK